MGTVLSSVEGTLLAGVLIVTLYTAYRAALPKPLASIPYNRDAARGLLGDIPEMVGYIVRTKRIFCWLTSLTTRHQSPIVQAFIKPMSLPWVVVTDPFESQDILLRRTKEFDRSGFFGELIGGILPEQHIQFLSSDARFKNNRNLINHLMAPTFITQVSGPQAYTSASTLIRLWKLKCNMAEGRPFAAHRDITYMALDTIFAAMFGHPESESIMIRRLQAVSAQRDKGKTKIPSNTAQPVLFPDAEVPEVFDAALTLANSVTDTQLSPLPRLTSWVLRQLPYMKKATAIKDKYIRDKVEQAVWLMDGGGSQENDTTSPRTALHSVLLRERDVAAKEGRRPDYRKRAIADEFFGFMLAGHDTSATTLAWGVKLLADHPAAQDRLRAELRAALLPEAAGKHAAPGPSYSALARAQIPYLDAVVEEVLRHANTIAFVVRVALQDTTVLGRHIPRGTDVFLMANGPGYLEPSLPVEDETRSPGARRRCGRGEEARSNTATPGGTNKTGLTGAWDDDDIAAFKPERWLSKDGDGAETFDPMAGPSLAFGLGPRGCFGRRFALHALKIQFGLLVWHFRLLPVPPELGGYEAVQKFAREPVRCYVRLSDADN